MIVACKGLLIPNHIFLFFILGEFGRAGFFNFGETKSSKITVVIANSLDILYATEAYQTGMIR